MTRVDELRATHAEVAGAFEAAVHCAVDVHLANRAAFHAHQQLRHAIEQATGTFSAADAEQLTAAIMAACDVALAGRAGLN